MKRDSFYAENISFSESKFTDLQNKAKGWKGFAIAGWSVAVIAVLGASGLATIHEFVPVVVKMDRLTGAVDVHTGKETIDINEPGNELLMTADLVRYVRAREGFTRAEAEINYNTVNLLSDPALHGAWDNEFNGARNPDALMLRLMPTDQIKIDNISVSFLPSFEKNTRVAQVRFDKIKRIGSNEPSMQRFVSTLTFTYRVAAIPTTVDGIALNFAGFQALNYRRDKETEEMPIAPVKASAPMDVFQAGEEK